MTCLTTHSTHFYIRVYGVGHMIKDSSAKDETRFLHYTGFSSRLTADNLLYAPFHRQNNTRHCLCYTSRGTLVWREIAQWVHHESRSDDPTSI